MLVTDALPWVLYPAPFQSIVSALPAPVDFSLHAWNRHIALGTLPSSPPKHSEYPACTNRHCLQQSCPLTLAYWWLVGYSMFVECVLGLIALSNNEHSTKNHKESVNMVRGKHRAWEQEAVKVFLKDKHMNNTLALCGYGTNLQTRFLKLRVKCATRDPDNNRQNGQMTPCKALRLEGSSGHTIP